MFREKVYYEVYEKEKDIWHCIDKDDIEEVYHVIMDITGDHDAATSAEAWCDLASIGEIYDHEKFSVEITLDD